MLTTQYFSCLVHFLAWYDEEVERCPHTFLTAMYKGEHSVFFGVHMKKSLSVQITLNKLLHAHYEHDNGKKRFWFLFSHWPCYG